ncbi:MAG: ATP-binding cassette domain-containing protein [Anaerolineae bacterium]|nr:ATP-binding cassette domain-containing protein [Anaerolineae bacterium]
MHTVEVSQLAKSFGDVHAVEDVSFKVRPGEIFALLGPNGAGKTTSIRLILDIFKPDRGSISVLGGEMDETKKARIGYMPEERGLYQEVALEKCLLYLASLKNVSKPDAQKRMNELLEQFDLAEHRTKKVKELSKGMQQKAQIIATILHKPELIIIDEPFTALDPVNTQMIKDIMRAHRRQGATIIMSTHQMHQVEELSDRLLLIDHGRNLLYGPLNEIRRQFSGHAVLVESQDQIPELSGEVSREQVNSTLKLELAEGVTSQEILQSMVEKGIAVDRFEVAVPSLDEIFIQAVAEEKEK